MQHIPSYLSEIFRLYSLDSILFSVFTFVAVYLLYEWLNERKNIPPGPYGLPFVGYIPFIGDDPSKSLDELGKKYGSIFSVKLGSNLMIILNDYEAMKQVLGDPGSLGRASSIFDFFINFGFGTANGEEWQEQRRATIQIIRDLGIGKSQWEGLVQEEVKQLVEMIENHKGSPVIIDSELRRCIINNFVSLLIGRNLTNSGEQQLASSYAADGFTEGSPVDLKSQSSLWSTLVKYLQLSDYHKRSQRVGKFFDFLKSEVLKHKTLPEYAGRKDFVNLYFEMMKNREPVSRKSHFSEHSLLGNLNVMYLAAADTTHITMTWLLRLMAKYPDVQRRVQDELDEVMGQNSSLSYDDREKLPYTTCVIMETLRYSSIEPLSSPRKVVSDIKVRGYTIPEGAQLSANLKKMHFDPMYWERPEEFRPERFMKNDGKVESNPKSYAPFSYGRRNCPGERILWMEALVCFGMICHRFTIRPPPGEEIHFEIIKGFVEALKPQSLCFTKR